MATDPFAQARLEMVRTQLERRGISDPAVLSALGDLPREAFVPHGRRLDPREVYRDGALPVGRGQTISQPFMVAFMTQALELPEGKARRVLEIGTGTGYQTAVLARLAREVWTVERDPFLAGEARTRLEALGIENVRCRVGDGSLGWPEGAPYDGILVTAGAPDVPGPLLEQLAPGGRLVLPVGSRDLQQLVRIVRGEDGAPSEPESLLDCRFVPLVGEAGWASEGPGP